MKTKPRINRKLRTYGIGVLVVYICLCSSFSCKKKDDTPYIPPVDTTQNDSVKSDVAYWLTTADQSVRLRKQNVSLIFKAETNQLPTITVDTTRTFQEMDGFGYCLTGGSAYLINRLPADDRNALIHELFSSDSACIGISYLRISIGSSDLDATTFSYDDMPAGQTDPGLTNFSLAHDETNLIPVLKQALSHNPDIKILGSPWSAPAWMKTNNSTIGGSLKPEYYDVYARYLVKYIQAMQTKGIRIDAITPQNEPLNPGNNPSMVMTATEQATFIRENLGPAFRSAGITTKIIVYDHNCDRPDYPITILSDAGASEYVDGSAFHLYGGDISALSQVHNAFPDKNVYFTEQWVGGPSNFAGDLKWHVKNLIIGAPANWSKNVLEWNLASDPSYSPHTNGGCTSCEGAITIGSSYWRNVSYYIVAHASKFVQAGSVRVTSNSPVNLPNVAFRTPSGKKVLIVLNEGSDEQTFNIRFNGKKVTPTLPSGAVATFVW